MEQKYLLLLTAVIAVIAVTGIITMQLLSAVVAIALILAVLIIVRFYEKCPSGSRTESEGEAIVAAALIAHLLVWRSPSGLFGLQSSGFC